MMSDAREEQEQRALAELEAEILHARAAMTAAWLAWAQPLLSLTAISLRYMDDLDSGRRAGALARAERHLLRIEAQIAGAPTEESKWARTVVARVLREIVTELRAAFSPEGDRTYRTPVGDSLPDALADEAAGLALSMILTRIGQEHPTQCDEVVRVWLARRLRRAAAAAEDRSRPTVSRRAIRTDRDATGHEA